LYGIGDSSSPKRRDLYCFRFGSPPGRVAGWPPHCLLEDAQSLNGPRRPLSQAARNRPNGRRPISPNHACHPFRDPLTVTAFPWKFSPQAEIIKGDVERSVVMTDVGQPFGSLRCRRRASHK